MKTFVIRENLSGVRVRANVPSGVDYSTLHRCDYEFGKRRETCEQVDWRDKQGWFNCTLDNFTQFSKCSGIGKG